MRNYCQKKLRLYSLIPLTFIIGFSTSYSTNAMVRDLPKVQDPTQRQQSCKGYIEGALRKAPLKREGTKYNCNQQIELETGDPLNGTNITNTLNEYDCNDKQDKLGLSLQNLGSEYGAHTNCKVYMSRSKPKPRVDTARQLCFFTEKSPQCVSFVGTKVDGCQSSQCLPHTEYVFKQCPSKTQNDAFYTVTRSNSKIKNPKPLGKITTHDYYQFCRGLITLKQAFKSPNGTKKKSQQRQNSVL